MSQVTNQEREELAKRRVVSSPRRAWKTLNRFRNVVPESGAIPKNPFQAVHSLNRGRITSYCAPGFGFYGIKLPLSLALLFLFLSSFCWVFLLPVLFLGIFLTWTVQAYLTAENITRDVFSINKESYH